MHLLIVEDNAFNAFCMTRLLEAVYPQFQITVVHDSVTALNYLTENKIALAIVDGDLGATDGLCCNGPSLVDAIWSNNPTQAVVAWSDSDIMRSAFAEVFHQHNKPLNEHNCWPKIITTDRIHQSLPYLLDSNEPFANRHADSSLERYV